MDDDIELDATADCAAMDVDKVLDFPGKYINDDFEVVKHHM